jgi:hypothetical protein
LESRGIAVDPSGDIYITGDTFSANFPVVNPLPAPNNALQGQQDAFVTRLRFNSATSALSFVYSTFLGGSGTPAGKVASYTGYDFATGIAVDSLGNAYVSGLTFTTDFPVVNPLQGGVSTGSILGSGFISKLTFNPASSTLALGWSTYVWGGDYTAVSGISVTAPDNAYVFGLVYGNNFPAVNSLPSGCSNGGPFVGKLIFNAPTSALSFAYSTCLPGSAVISALAVDSSGSAYITGRADGQGLPIVNPLPPPNNNLQGTEDAFLTKISFSPPPVPFASAPPKLSVTAGPPSAYSRNEAIVLGA